MKDTPLKLPVKPDDLKRLVTGKRGIGQSLIPVFLAALARSGPDIELYYADLGPPNLGRSVGRPVGGERIEGRGRHHGSSRKKVERAK